MVKQKREESAMQEEKKKILQSVQDGKMTAEEAFAILEELEKAEQESEKKEQVLKNELSTEVVQEKKKSEEDHSDHDYDYFKKNIHSTKEKILDFVESAFQKIKDNDLDFNFGKSVDVSHIFQHDETAINEINIEIANGKTKIVAWDAQEVRVECQAKVYRVEDQEKARELFVKNTLFMINDGKMKFYIQDKGMKVDAVIYVPKKDYENVQIRMFNGAIIAEALWAEHVKVKSANGAITVEGVHGENCDLETGNGAIAIQTSQFDKLEAETLNGAIQAGGNFKKVDMQTFNGQIVCRNERLDSESIYAKSVTGKIQLSLAAGTVVSGELKSNLGSFNVSLEGINIVEEKNDVIQKSLIFKTIQEQPAFTHIFAESKTGAISVS